MSARPDIWMPFYVGDYLRDTSRLTRDQHGGYVLLIIDYWVNGPLPDDDEQLAAIVKASPEEWARLRPRLEPFFRVGVGVWRHKRIDVERGKATAHIERLERLARSGREAQARRKKTASAEPNARANARSNDASNTRPSHEGEGEGEDFSKGATFLKDLDRGRGGNSVAAVTRDVAALQ